MKRYVPSVSDFSGQNWDELVSNLLIESVRDRFPPYAAQREVRALNGSSNQAKNVYVLNAAASSHLQALEEVREQENRPDLSQSDLHGSDLSRADLRGANLSRANLMEAKLDHANLENADLRGADLRSAHLSAARLKDARLYGAIINRWTTLPFDKDTALSKGMIYLEVTAERQ